MLVTKYVEVGSGNQTYVVRTENKHLYTLKHFPTPNWVIWQTFLSIIHFE